MTLTGRYKFQPDRGGVALHVEEHAARGFFWRPAVPSDLTALEPEVRDGWRFREERDGLLDPLDGRRY